MKTGWQPCQNTILLCNAANLKQNKKDLVFVIVCRTENKMCMIHRCGSCPGKDILYLLFKTEMLTSESTDNVVYMQWQSSDKTILKSENLIFCSIFF